MVRMPLYVFTGHAFPINHNSHGKSHYWSLFHSGTNHLLRQQNDWVGGWVQKAASFVDVQNFIYAEILGGWVRKIMLM